MKPILVLAALLATAAPAFAQAEPPCADDARARAERLLRFHAEVADLPVHVDDAVTAVAPIATPVGSGRLDVLEVWGYVYRAQYRMHFIYAQIPGSCALTGQEILEWSNPY